MARRAYDDPTYKRNRLRVLERDGYTCQYCQRPAKTVDHLVPVARGGGNEVDNLVACCSECNSRRGQATQTQDIRARLKKRNMALTDAGRDLDVAAPPGGIPWVPASRFYTQAEDGLASPWHGRVWMNPPYSKPEPWVRKFLEHGHGIALVQVSKARWFDEVWNGPTPMVLNHARFKFSQGGIFMPTVFLGLGDECIEAIGRIGRTR